MPALAEHSSGLTRALLVGGHTGSTHTGLTLVELADGHVDTHLHSFETSFYVLDGEPALYLDGHAVRLKPGACGAIPVGTIHAWRSDASARWVEMASPRPRAADQPPDTFFVAPAPDTEPAPLDVRDPRNRNLFLLTPADMELDRLKQGAPVDQPTVSASMATAALAYSGITVKMLVDKRLDAQLQTMFMVAYQPGAVAHPHDHPFEESYVMLEGDVDVVADGERYTLAPGRRLLDRRRLHPRVLRGRGQSGPLARDVRSRPTRPPLVPLRPRLAIPGRPPPRRVGSRSGRLGSDRGSSPRGRGTRARSSPRGSARGCERSVRTRA